MDRTDEVPFRLLVRVPEASVGEDSGNEIVRGDNLEVLKALLPSKGKSKKSQARL